MPAKSYREDLLKRLLDSNYASQYLKVAFDETLKDGNMEAFLLALKNIVDAKCSVQEVANEAQVSRQNLHLLLSGKGNQSIETIVSVLHAVGLTIDFKPNPE
jgi:DNA-binding phage protein